MEIFKDIIGYEGIYQISNYGNVKSLLRGIILKKRLLDSNYYSTALTKNGIRKEFKDHRLVALHFLNNINNNEIVNHLDGNKLNNNIDNLEWVNCRENLHHCRQNKKVIGISKIKGRDRWVSRIMINGKNKNLGYFKCETSAYIKYIIESKKNNLINKYI